jgi:hypothetical protein
MPTPPIDMLMPVQANFWFTVIAYSVFAVVIIVMLRRSIKDSSILPLCFLAGGTLSFLTEPFFDVVVCAWYPSLNTTSFYSAFGVSIPLWLIPAWGIYMGAQTFYVYEAFKKGISFGRLIVLFPIFWLTNVSFEIPGLLLGIYTYYGPQPLKIFGFPAWMGMSNAIMPIIIATVFYVLRAHISGARALLIVPMYPGISIAAGGIAAWPMWLTLNSGFTATQNIITTGVVLLLCTIALNVCAKLVQSYQEPIVQ